MSLSCAINAFTTNKSHQEGDSFKKKERIWKQRPRAKFLQPTLLLTQNVCILYFLYTFLSSTKKKTEKFLFYFFSLPFLYFSSFLIFLIFLVCAISFFFWLQNAMFVQIHVTEFPPFFQFFFLSLFLIRRFFF